MSVVAESFLDELAFNLPVYLLNSSLDMLTDCSLCKNIDSVSYTQFITLWIDDKIMDCVYIVKLSFEMDIVGNLSRVISLFKEDYYSNEWSCTVWKNIVWMG